MMNIRKYILLAASLVLVIFIGYRAYLRYGKGVLMVQATPSDTITIINEKYYTPDQSKEITLSPGKYQVTLVADGYQTSVTTIAMGWKSQKVITTNLDPKSFKEIAAAVMPNLEETSYSIAQPKFFLQNTWAAGYILSGADESAIAIAILQRVNGKWRVVYYDDQPVNRSSTTLPDPVYDYVKAYKGE